MIRGTLAAVAGLALLAACSSDPTGSAADVAYDFSFDDPAADTAAATTNPEQVRATDLLRTSGRVEPEAITLVLEFAEPISKWSDGTGNALDGFIYFDTDQGIGTGVGDVAPRTVGAEFYLDLRDNGSGRVGLVDFLKRTITVLDATFDGTRFEVKVPRSAIATATDSNNKLNLSVQLGNRGRAPLSDRSDPTKAYRLEPPVTP